MEEGLLCTECNDNAQRNWYTALKRAILLRHQVCSHILLEQESRDWIQLNAVQIAQYAAEYGRVEIIRHLMNCGVLDVSAPCRSGLSGPLIHAVRRKNTETVRFLLAAGAPVNHAVPINIDKHFTALDFALPSRNRELIHVLLDAGARIHYMNKEPTRSDDPHMWGLFLQRRRCVSTATILYGILRNRYRVRAPGFADGYRLQRELAQQIAQRVWEHRTDVKGLRALDRMAKRAKKK